VHALVESDQSPGFIVDFDTEEPINLAETRERIRIHLAEDEKIKMQRRAETLIRRGYLRKGIA
jgi:hypothetical protein